MPSFNPLQLRLLVVALAFTVSSSASIGAATKSPYAGQETRPIKSLSEAEVTDLLQGNGMGFAKAAELNGYPGPAHVLELSPQLGLSPKQVAQTRLLQARMKAEAQAAGGALVAAERDVDVLFRSRSATPDRLTHTLARVAAAQAKVREAHLRAHIEQTRLLSPEQVERYARLRGYSAGDDPGAHRHDRHGAPR